MGDDVITIRGLDPSAPAEQDESAVLLSLRHRAAAALERALGFVKDYGDELAVLRAHAALEAVPSRDAVEVLATRQSDDGSFPPLSQVFSGQVSGELRSVALPPALVGTLEAMSVLADLRGLASSCAEHAIAYLTRAQRSDGSWGRLDRRAGESPESARERAIEERLFATGMLAGFAARTPYVRPEVLTWAASFLADAWAPERVEGGGWPVIAAFAHFYANGGDPERSDAALQWCGRELERGFRTHRFEASEIVRVLLYCDATAIPGATFDAVELLGRLLDEQAADGGFSALDPGGPPGRVAPTVDALLALKVLCRAL